MAAEGQPVPATKQPNPDPAKAAPPDGHPKKAAISRGERYREIVAVLMRHGVGVFGDELLKHETGEHARAQHLRRACEDLGTMFIKLGQVLSTRSDLLPDAYRLELAKLCDQVPPLPSDAIAEVIRQDLGAPIDQLFAFFDPQVLGCASIGQVHAAKLLDGREVVVKVRKPGIDEVVKIDLEILAHLIEEWTPRFPMLEQLDAASVAREFSDELRDELDYSREGKNEGFFRDLFAKEQGFKIPGVIPELSKSRVLTQERVSGRKPNDVSGLSKRCLSLASQRLARFVMEPAFEHGVFYADPHPGNILIHDDGSLSVIDFGQVGRLSAEARRSVAGIFIAIAQSDAPRLTDRLLEITSPKHPIDRDQITSEINRMLVLYVDVSLEHIRFGEAMRELLDLVRRHGLRMPGNLVQFFKALAMCEGMLQAIDPDASFLDYLKPMMGKMIYQAYAGSDIKGRLRDSAIDAAELALELPRRIDRLLGEVERGNLRIWTRVEDAEPLMKRLGHMVGRVNAAILTAACIIGIAEVMPFYRNSGWRGWIGVGFWIAIGVAVANTVRMFLTSRK